MTQELITYLHDAPMEVASKIWNDDIGFQRVEMGPVQRGAEVDDTFVDEVGTAAAVGAMLRFLASEDIVNTDERRASGPLLRVLGEIAQED